MNEDNCWKEFNELRKRDDQEQRDAAKKDYLRAVEASRNEVEESFVHTAQVLRDAIYKKEYDSILVILDKTVLPDGHSFGIQICETGGYSLGDWSKPFIQEPDGKKSESIFEFLRFENSCVGAWHAFLLHQMWHYLPLWWHANYDHRHYHYSPEDEPVFKDPLPIFTKKEMIYPDFSQFDLSPEIRAHEGKYYISCCYWTSFGGLIREYVEFTLNEGRMEGFFPFDEKTLIKYDCGILF